MDRPIDPKVTIFLDKERTLEWDFDSGLYFEAQYGKSITAALNDSGFTATLHLVAAGLKMHYPRITTAQVAEILKKCVKRGDDINDITKQALKALLASGIMGNFKIQMEEETVGDFDAPPSGEAQAPAAEEAPAGSTGDASPPSSTPPSDFPQEG